MSPAKLWRYWLPPLVWMAVIFWFSTDTFSGQETGSILKKILTHIGLNLSPEELARLHFLIRKLAHLTAYFVLGALLWRAFRGDAHAGWDWRWAGGAFLVAAVYALVDEYHQSLTRTRTPSVVDSLIDMFGSVIALTALWLNSRIRRVRGGAPERGK